MIERGALSAVLPSTRGGRGARSLLRRGRKRMPRSIHGLIERTLSGKESTAIESLRDHADHPEKCCVDGPRRPRLLRRTQ